MDKQHHIAKVDIPGVGSWPRRQSVPHLTEEEIMIAKVIDAVEKLGADIELTSCVQHLVIAKDRLANFIDAGLPEPAVAE